LGSNVNQGEAESLYRAVRAVQPVTSVEVGFGQGISALAILQAMKDNGVGHHHVIDPFQDTFSDAGVAMTERAGFDAMRTFYRKFADEVVPGLPQLDFAFIDASHLFDLTLSEFVMVDRKLRTGGLVAFHDMWMSSQRALIRYILANRSYEIVREFASPDQNVKPISLRRRLMRTLTPLLKLLPMHERIFSTEVLTPFWTLNISNLVVLRKTADDSRHWTFHQKF
jgi:predicted O-methyltransferase YrrM